MKRENEQENPCKSWLDDKVGLQNPNRASINCFYPKPYCKCVYENCFLKIRANFTYMGNFKQCLNICKCPTLNDTVFKSWLFLIFWRCVNHKPLHYLQRMNVMTAWNSNVDFLAP